MSELPMIGGIFPATMTAFTKEGAIDAENTARHVDYLIKSGAHGIVATGTSGEFIAMTEAERLRHAELGQRKQTRGRNVLIAAAALSCVVLLADPTPTNVERLASKPSPWLQVSEPRRAADLLSDATALQGHLRVLRDVDERQRVLREQFRAGTRDYYVPADSDEIQDAVAQYATRASHVVCVGTCASWGGIPKSGSNPTGIQGVSEYLGEPTINISGCPANPMWVVKAIVKLLLGQPVPLDAHGRPIQLYEAYGNIHDSCPRWNEGNNKATALGQDGKCLWDLGCRGPYTKANCHNNWNGIAGMGHWCIGVNAPCHGCTEPDFPGPQSFYDHYTPTD